MEYQGKIEYIENATQKEINDVSITFVNLNYCKKKRKTFLAQKKETITFINGNKIFNYSKYIISLISQNPGPKCTALLDEQFIFFPGTHIH